MTALILIAFVAGGLVQDLGYGGVVDESTLSDHTSIRADANADPGEFIKPPSAPVTAVERPAEDVLQYATAGSGIRSMYTDQSVSGSRFISFRVPGSSSVRRAILHVYRL